MGTFLIKKQKQRNNCMATKQYADEYNLEESEYGI